MPHPRTQYVIKLPIGVYARANMSWSQHIDDALRFEFMTTAIGYAILTLDLAPVDFDVVPV